MVGGGKQRPYHFNHSGELKLKVGMQRIPSVSVNCPLLTTSDQPVSQQSFGKYNCSQHTITTFLKCVSSFAGLLEDAVTTEIKSKSDEGVSVGEEMP